MVPLFARGVGADLFVDFITGNDTIRGDYIDNTDVYTVMDMVLGGSDECLGDFDSDGDVDGSDLSLFAADFGRTDCSGDCEGDFDTDGDVDGSDLAVFAADFGRTDCDVGPPCEGDFDGDNDVDGTDLAVFAADFGRTDCP